MDRRITRSLVLLTKEVKPSPHNPRRIPDDAVDAVAASMERFGFIGELIVDEDYMLLAGHTRLKAAKKLGMVEVPATKVSGLSEREKNAFRVADNRTAELSGWDDVLLSGILATLADELPPGFCQDDVDEINTLLDDLSTERAEFATGQSGAGDDSEMPLNENTTDGADDELVLRVKRSVRAEAKERCEAIIQELEG